MSRIPHAGLLAGGIFFVSTLPAPSLATDRFVSTTGTDPANTCASSASPCATIGHALTQVAGGDVLKVARGTYGENLLIDVSGSFAISGGWSIDFGQQDAFAFETRVDGGGVDDTLMIAAGAGESIGVTLSALTISGGGPDTTGAGIRAETAGTGAITLAVVDCELRQNGLAGLYARSDSPGSLSVTVSDSLITRNRNDGIRITGVVNVGGVVDLSVSDSTISRNAGGVFARTAGGSLSFTSVVFDTNRARSYTINTFAWGGLDLASFDSTGLTVDRCTFRKNKTHRFGPGGGAVRLESGHGLLTAAITNSLMTRNRAYSIGALAAYAFDDGSIDLDVTNCTITRNRQGAPFHDPATGAVYVAVSDFGSGTAQLDLKNSILWKNVRKDFENYSGSVTVNADHNDVGEGLIGSVFNDLGGNVQVDPLLRAGGHLDDSSPVIDAGTCTGAPATDFEGDPRPTGAGCDIGADEFVP